MPCRIEGCDGPVKVKSRRLCNKHYRRFQRTGDPLGSVPRSKTHGLTGYDYHGCRCDICKDAKSAATKALKARLRGSESTPHGTTTGYNLYGCRCAACTEALRSYQEAVRERRTTTAIERRSRRWREGSEVEFAHGYSGYINHGCHCPICMAAVHDADRRKVEQDRDAVGEAPRSEARSQWTGPELELILTRDDLDDRELGRMLGRTVKAIRNARYRARRDPKWTAVAGVGRS